MQDIFNATIKEIRGKGKRPHLYGWVVKMEGGECLYVARRRFKQIFRGGEASISEGMAASRAGWAIDEDTLIKVRAMGAKTIIVRCIDIKEEFVSPIENYFKRGNFSSINYEGVGRGGAKQRVVPLDKFERRPRQITYGGFSLK